MFNVGGGTPIVAEMLIFRTQKKATIERWMECSEYLVGTGDDGGKLVFLLVLALDHGLENGWVVRSQVDEDIGHASLFR